MKPHLGLSERRASARHGVRCEEDRSLHACENHRSGLKIMSIAMNDDPGRPTLTQVQIIQSLAEALSWFEKEISWGVSLGELRHLTGRIGELYAAMITRGQMTLDTNQRGYDVVSAA